MEKNMIGKYLRDLRRRRGMSQQELGLALGALGRLAARYRG